MAAVAVRIGSEAEWLEQRSINIGGSEIAGLFSLWRLPDGETAVFHCYEEPPSGSLFIEEISPYTSGYRLWAEKSGILPPDSLAENERVQAGTFMEPALAEWSRAKFGWNVRKVRRYLRHDTVAGMGGSLDYEVIEPGMPPAEFKNVDGLVFANRWSVGEDDAPVPPLSIILQLQHQIALTRATHGWIVVCVAGNRLMRTRIDRHEPTITRIQEAITAFWLGVEARVPPPASDPKDVSKVFRYGKAAQSVDMSADAALARDCRRLKRWRAHAKLVDAQVDRMEARVRATMGEATKATALGFKLSWPTITTKETTIVKPAVTYRGALTITPIKEGGR